MSSELHKSVLRVALAAVFVVCTIGPGSLPAQSRSRITLSTPGNLQTIGQSGASYNFNTYSYGLGTLAKPSPGTGGAALRSTIGSALSFSLRSSLASSRSSSGSTTGLIKPAPAGSRLYTPSGSAVQSPGGSGGVGKALLSGNRPILGAAHAYLEALGAGSMGGDANSKAVSSLVPAEPSRYKDLLERGEEAFRDGRFTNARLQFQLANDIGGRDPESLLSLAHTAFALSTVSYAKPANYISRALRYFPELPLVPLRPRDFYGDRITYAQHLQRLRKQVRSAPTDAEAHLVLAYFEWFGGRGEVAREYLATAARYAATPELAEAIDTFWAGMLASGKISGPLHPKTQPATTTKPKPADALNSDKNATPVAAASTASTGR